MRFKPTSPLIGLALVAGLAVSASGAFAVDRARLEAAIVYNILLFVEWPGEAALAAGDPLTLCLDGATPVARELHALAGRPVRRMKLAVRDLAEPKEGHACSALYVDSEAGRRAFAAHGEAAEHGMLVIGGSDPVPVAGATIQLSESERRTVFDVDARAARQAGLVISSRLLRLARRIAE